MEGSGGRSRSARSLPAALFLLPGLPCCSLGSRALGSISPAIVLWSRSRRALRGAASHCGLRACLRIARQALNRRRRMFVHPPRLHPVCRHASCGASGATRGADSGDLVPSEQRSGWSECVPVPAFLRASFRRRGFGSQAIGECLVFFPIPRRPETSAATSASATSAALSPSSSPLETGVKTSAGDCFGFFLHCGLFHRQLTLPSQRLRRTQPADARPAALFPLAGHLPSISGIFRRILSERLAGQHHEIFTGVATAPGRTGRWTLAPAPFRSRFHFPFQQGRQLQSSARRTWNPADCCRVLRGGDVHGVRDRRDLPGRPGLHPASARCPHFEPRLGEPKVPMPRKPPEPLTVSPFEVSAPEVARCGIDCRDRPRAAAPFHLQDLFLDGAHYGVVFFVVLKKIGNVQKSVAVESDIDECGLHSRQYARDAPFVDTSR